MYLEQELESLKAVLEIRNHQLHQKEKKLVEMDKLVSTALLTALTEERDPNTERGCDVQLSLDR